MSRIPIWEALQAYRDSHTINLHVPGHKRGQLYQKQGIDLPVELLELDTTEVSGIDNLFQPQSSIKEAQEIAAKVFGAKDTYFLVNGTSGGIIAMLLAVAKPGDKIIIPRNCHKSVISGAILAGLQVAYIYPKEDRITPQQVEEAFRIHEDAKAVLITSPTYYGICSDLASIASITHNHKALLLVDEAHGSHFAFHPELPITALEAGADLCVQSTHKTLAAMTGGSMLHIGSNRINKIRIEQALSMVQTSSPSHIMLATIDLSRHIMQMQGYELLDQLIKDCKKFRKKINEIEGLSCVDSEIIDITRLTIDLSQIGITGMECDQLLRNQYGIQIEMADKNTIIAVVTVADHSSDIEAFLEALAQIAQKHKKVVKVDNPIQYQEQKQIMSLQQAFYANKRQVAVAASVGEVAGEMVVPYPPGIPILCPGEVITQENVLEIQKCLYENKTVYGIMEGQITVIE